MYPTVMAAAAAERRREFRDAARQDHRVALVRAARRRRTVR
jgi:hypothetical protein